MRRDISPCSVKNRDFSILHDAAVPKSARIEATLLELAGPAILGASALILIATAATLTAPLIWSTPHCRPFPQHQNYLEVKAERCGR